MKTIVLHFEDKEAEILAQKKGRRTWREFVEDFVKSEEKNDR